MGLRIFYITSIALQCIDFSYILIFIYWYHTVTFDPMLYWLIPQPGAEAPLADQVPEARITWPTPWGYRRGNLRLTCYTWGVLFLADRCLTQWFLWLINHTGFHWAGWKLTAFVCGDKVVLCSHVRLVCKSFKRCKFCQHVHPQTLLFTITTSIKASEGYEGRRAGQRLLLCPSRRKKRGGRRESRCSHLSFPDIRGGLVGIMEARKPDRQGRPASLQASSLPRFISYCHVTAWLGLLVSVCVFLCPVCVCSDVGLTREDGGGHIGQSKLHVYCVNVMAAITRFC